MCGAEAFSDKFIAVPVRQNIPVEWLEGGTNTAFADLHLWAWEGMVEWMAIYTFGGNTWAGLALS